MGIKNGAEKDFENSAPNPYYYPKKTFTRGKLMEDFWDFDSSATSRTVDVYMAKLRDKTKNCNGFEILTVHGLGYKVILK